METVKGRHGLFYVFDIGPPPIFVAGRTREEAHARVQTALEVYAGRAENVEGHQYYTDDAGGGTFLPLPEWQTDKQRKETIKNLKRALELFRPKGNT